MQLNMNIKNKSIMGKKWQRTLHRYFSKEDMHTSNRHIKGCSTSLIIKEMQRKPTNKYYSILIRMCIINKLGLPWWLLQCRRHGLIPGLGRSPGGGMKTHSSNLAWRIPWAEEPARLQSTGSHSQTRLNN